MCPLLLVVAALWPTALRSQWTPVPAEELSHAIERNRVKYLALGDLQLGYEILTFLGVSDIQPVQRARARVLRSGTKYRSEQTGFLTVQDGHLKVMIDSVSQTVTIAAADSGWAGFGTEYSRTMLARAQSIGKHSTGGRTTYRVMMGQGPVDALEVGFDASGWLRSTTIFFAPSSVDRTIFKSPKLETVFEVPRTLSDRTAMDWDISRSVVKEAGGYRPVKALATYELIDTRLQ
ncbi:MAG: hypothetical protein QM724_13380 [Flavobacteriales bacterium]